MLDLAVPPLRRRPLRDRLTAGFFGARTTPPVRARRTAGRRKHARQFVGSRWSDPQSDGVQRFPRRVGRFPVDGAGVVGTNLGDGVVRAGRARWLAQSARRRDWRVRHDGQPGHVIGAVPDPGLVRFGRCHGCGTDRSRLVCRSNGSTGHSQQRGQRCAPRRSRLTHWTHQPDYIQRDKT